MSIFFTDAGLRSPLPPLLGDDAELFRELLNVVKAVGEDVAVVAVVVVVDDAEPVVAVEDLSLKRGDEVEPRPSRYPRPEPKRP